MHPLEISQTDGMHGLDYCANQFNDQILSTIHACVTTVELNSYAIMNPSNAMHFTKGSLRKFYVFSFLNQTTVKLDIVLCNHAVSSKVASSLKHRYFLVALIL